MTYTVTYDFNRRYNYFGSCQLQFRNAKVDSERFDFALLETRVVNAR